ncbi:response regulator [Fundidesulfovibrio terrae]|uniref:response regulator n=1 Tax=Fundidesulfovibrio terrae TaxID=2922866 RepID=UPI001FAE8109|nr:response regulator [Fundidesulfovibrio terrae]
MDELAIQRLRRVLGDTCLLVVDDTPIIRGIISGILEPLGLQKILQASNGEEAWELLKAGNVDIVVADWLMPGINGLDLLKRMRQDPGYAQTPFIMITGVPDKQVVMEAMKLDVTDFMVKPIDGSVLKQKILKSLSRNIS